MNDMNPVFGEINVHGISRHVLAGLLRATPVAMRGQNTMIPRADALAISENDAETFSDVMRELLKPRTLTRVQQWTTFPILDEIRWIDNGAFLEYRVNSTFLKVLATFS